MGLILETIRRLGFNEKWVGLVRQCISSVSFRALVNGEPTEAF